MELLLPTQTSRTAPVEWWAVEIPDDAVLVAPVYDPAEYQHPDLSALDPEWIRMHNGPRPH